MHPNVHRSSFLIGCIIIAGCSSSDTTATNLSTMTKFAGDNQSVVASGHLAINPAVKIVDGTGTPVSGVAVNFAVASGGGVILGPSTTTGSDGVATAGQWTVGATGGTNTVTATATGVTGSPVTFTATSVAVSAMSKVAGDGQSGLAHSTLPIAPAAKVVDASGNPIPGVAVFFAVASGGGTITGGSSSTTAVIITNASGLAALTSWTLGTAAGANTVTATTARSNVAGDPVTFSATGQ